MGCNSILAVVSFMVTVLYRAVVFFQVNGIV